MTPAASAPPPAVRVLFVAPNADVGGSEVYLQRLLVRLPEDVFAWIAVLDRGPTTEFFARLGAGLTVFPTHPLLRLPAAAVRLRRTVARHRIDVVHANGIKPALLAVIALRDRQVPVVWVKHDFSWDGPLVRWIARRCDVVVGVSDAVTAGLPAGVDVRTVHNGVPTATAAPDDARRRLAQLADLPAGAVVVMAVGRLDSGKGQLALVEALPEVLRRLPDTILVIIGPTSRFEPGYRDTLEARSRELGVAASVRLLGPREDAVELMAGADVVAVVSAPYTRRGTGEGFGLVAAEAMAAGVPVVATDHGGLREVVEGAGLLVAYGAIPALADAIVRIVEEPGLAAELARRGRLRAAGFDLDALASEMVTLFGELAGRRLSAAPRGR